MRADGRALPFDDATFDVAFSNAVVEHVAGGREGQRQFVHELCRVARRVFVTTPNRFFPLEVHTLLPFAHWLPEAPRTRVLRRAGFDDVLDPLGPRELASLFPYSGACTQSRYDADRGGARMTRARPVWALHVLIVGLALHNLVMSQLWRAGVRGNALTVVAAWKDVLLLVALVLVVALGCAAPSEGVVDWLALVVRRVRRGLRRAAAVVARRGATHRGVLYAARHDLLPVGAYFLGRGLALTARERSALCRTVLGTAVGRRRFGLSTSTRCRSRGGATPARRAGSRISSACATTASRGCPRTSSTTRGTASCSAG